jgi:REP element-mobilizing transposase RayT
MSHTHFLFHIVFGTKDRFPLIAESWEPEFHKYLGGIVKNHSGEAIEINGMPDHVHLLVRLGPHEAFKDLMRELKASSSSWAKRKHQPKFAWQRRYGAFSVSESMSESVRKYIRSQKEHHETRAFEDEYKEILSLHKVEFDERFLWE